MTRLQSGWLTYLPTECCPFLAIVPAGDDDHPLPHRVDSMECHCLPEVRLGDGKGPFTHPMVIHSAFDGRELVEAAEALAGDTG